MYIYIKNINININENNIDSKISNEINNDIVIVKLVITKLIILIV